MNYVPPSTGLYCSGWLSTGPVGVILSTMTAAFSTAQIIHKDIADKKIDIEVKKPGSQHIRSIAEKKGDQFKLNEFLNF